ncbi:hypothetical protein ACJMK2_024794 [Sinanodonta woodiana]|uniref:Mab-21-like HhH/H2TH-like domain-containing protein n=1 Tax=Sinanodonta woodiana TaxID=1069815 RepID=A0ABD3XI29_SINWO
MHACAIVCIYGIICGSELPLSLENIVFTDPAILLHDDTILDPVSGLPLPHLDFLYHDIVNSPFVLLPSGAHRNPGSMRQTVIDDIGFYGKVVGFWINVLEILPDIPPTKLEFLDTWEEVHQCVCICQFKNQNPLNIYCIPNDTYVFARRGPTVKDSDMIMESVFGKPGYVKLTPVLSKLWEGALIQEDEEHVYLHHLQVNDPFPQKLQACWEELDYGAAIIAFRCPWPKEADEWRTRKRSTGWLQTTTQNTIVEDGCYLLPCGRSRESVIEWKFCFDLAEEWLIRRCVFDHFSKVYRAFKLLIKTTRKDKAEATNYRQILRHVFYYACEEVPEKFWIRRPARCILFMLSRLLQQLQAGVVPHYFMSNVNLLDLEDIDIDELRNSICVIRGNPLLSTYYLLEERRLTSTRVRLKLDHSIDDIREFADHKIIQRSKETFFTTETMIQVNILVKEGKLAEAEYLITLLLREMYETDNNITFIDIVQEVLFNMNYSDRWYFAFYTDLVNETKLLDHVCNGVPNIPLSHILGPEISSNIHDCMVPKECITPNILLEFVNKVTLIFEHINWHKSVFHALKFFLDQAYDEKTQMYQFDHMQKIGSAATEVSISTCYQSDCYRKDVILACIYRRFFAAGLAIERPEIASYITRYEAVCERIQIDRFYSDLGRIFISFGKEERGKVLMDKAKQCRKPPNWILNEICAIANGNIYDLITEVVSIFV